MSTQYPTLESATVVQAQALFDATVEGIRALDGIEDALDRGVDAHTVALHGGIADLVIANVQVIANLTPAFGTAPKDVHARAVARAKR